MKHIIIIVTSVLLAIATGCKPNDPTPNDVVVVETAPISLHLHTYIGQYEVDDYNVVYRTDDDRKVSLSFAQLYISNIKLVKFDGTLYSVKDTTILTSIGEQVYKLGNVPVGNYKSIRFDVGLPNAINSNIPSGTGILNNPDMWFTNTAQANNYIFMKALGKIDTTAAKNSSDGNMAPFVYKIGTSNRLVKVSMPDQNVSVQPGGGTAYIHMKADYAELFEGLDLRDETNLSIDSKTDNELSLSIDIAARIPYMFKYEN